MKKIRSKEIQNRTLNACSFLPSVKCLVLESTMRSCLHNTAGVLSDSSSKYVIITWDIWIYHGSPFTHLFRPDPTGCLLHQIRRERENTFWHKWLLWNCAIHFKVMDGRKLETEEESWSDCLEVPDPISQMPRTWINNEVLSA